MHNIGRKGIEIEIVSFSGQFMFKREADGTIQHIDLYSFQPGVYFITIRLKDFITTRKIVKL